jgi:hypothetical protein
MYIENPIYGLQDLTCTFSGAFGRDIACQCRVKWERTGLTLHGRITTILMYSIILAQHTSIPKIPGYTSVCLSTQSWVNVGYYIYTHISTAILTIKYCIPKVKWSKYQYTWNLIRPCYTHIYACSVRSKVVTERFFIKKCKTTKRVYQHDEYLI